VYRFKKQASKSFYHKILIHTHERNNGCTTINKKISNMLIKLEKDHLSKLE
jgi:hypothetical protein